MSPAPEPTPSRAPASPLGSAAVAILAGTASSYSFLVLPVLRDALQSYLHIGLSQFGLLLSIGAAPGAVCALVFGARIARVGARRVLRAALVGSALGYLAVAAAHGWAAMLGAVLLITCFQSGLAIAVQSYLTDLFPGAQRRVLSIFLVSGAAVGACLPLWAEVIVGAHASSSPARFALLLHLPFAIVGAILLLGAAWLGPRAARAAGETETPHASAWRGKPLQRGSLALVGLLVLHITCDNSAYLWMSRVLGSYHAASALTPGLVMSAFSLVYAGSRAVLAMMPEHVGRRALLTAPGLLGGTAFALGVLSHQHLLTAVGYVLGGLLWSLEYPTLLATLARREGSNFGFAQGLVMVGAGLTTFVVPYGMGLLGSALGEARLWTILLGPALGFLSVGAGGALWLATHRGFAQAAGGARDEEKGSE